MNIYLFLDFDGVTHPQPCFQEIEFFCLSNIEAVLHEFPQISIVISSSWREHYSLEDLREFFNCIIANRVIDVTPFYRDPKSDWLPETAAPIKYERQWEIESWLKSAHLENAQWIAIDDQPQGFEPGCENLLITNPATGFTPYDEQLLHDMIKARLGANQ